MIKFRNLIILVVLIFFISGCDKPDKTKMKTIHFDRDMCALCKMVISERHYAVQVVNPTNGRSYMFDDIGCTILWFKEEKISWEKEAKIYIADAKTGEFIDARKAFYDTRSRTPMDYGFGAYSKNFESSIDFKEMRLKILRGETMQNPQIRKGNL